MHNRQPRLLLIAWILLLVLGGLFVFASLSDLAADLRTGLPTDHMETLRVTAGLSWDTVRGVAPGIAMYITLLEITYAAHEMVFALLFLLIVAIPFRQRARWAWWACWVPMIANLTYSFTFANHSTTTLIYSLIADILLPILLLVHIPAFFGRSREQLITHPS